MAVDKKFFKIKQTMSLIPYSMFPRRMFDMDTWMTPSWGGGFGGSSGLGLDRGGGGFGGLGSSLLPSTLDLFDPFDELDRTMSRNLRWIDRPESLLSAIAPVVPHKYRISVDCAGFNSDNIKTEIKQKDGDQYLHVHGREEQGTKGADDYTKKVLRKSYKLPNNIQLDQMASFMAPGGNFIVEFPIKQEDRTSMQGMLPQIVDSEGGGKQLKLNLPLPQNIDPNKVQLSLKDRDLIMRVEDRTETDDTRSRVHFYTRTTLPENTDFNQLKCVVDNGQLNITAPVNTQQPWGYRQIPVEMKGQQQQIMGGAGQQQQQRMQQGGQGQQQGQQKDTMQA